ncbi:hypothetical protein F5X68DRAFT_258974 [Plectosphaerella plurivora]|uniref:2EXR domain-containing protein n=1 Tax=Plectosphaerella plurivora TaxID=936078 RepID=A0A9P8VIE9_9PEZI|nr:hypothetical protein F5X68DRAFT_258974 [Plectosphaerella plurivora]
MSTFHFFPILPTEIRLLVWNHSVRDPTRIVHLGQQKYSTQCWGWTKEQGVCPKAIFSATADPAILHVNEEARSVGEAYYTQAFCCPLHQSLSYPADHCVWLNFDTDIVEIASW